MKLNPSVPHMYQNTQPSYLSCDISSYVDTNKQLSAEEQCLIKNDTFSPDRMSHGKIKESNSDSLSITPLLVAHNNKIAIEIVKPTKRVASIDFGNSVGKETTKTEDNHHNNISEKMLPLRSSKKKWQAIMDNLVQTVHVTDESTNLIIATNAVKAKICDPDKLQNDCSIKNDLQISNTLEAHIESSDDCIDKVFEGTDRNKVDDKTCCEINNILVKHALMELVTHLMSTGTSTNTTTDDDDDIMEEEKIKETKHDSWRILRLTILFLLRKLLVLVLIRIKKLLMIGQWRN